MSGRHDPDGMGYRRTTRRGIEYSNSLWMRSRLNFPKYTDSVLELVRLKLESRVIVHKYGTVNVNFTGVLTARHGLGSTNILSYRHFI